jgi:iron transport multicopper oxidase
LGVRRRVGLSTLLLACACGSTAPGGGMPRWFGLKSSAALTQVPGGVSVPGIGASADDLRTGWYPNQPALHPLEVSSPSFQPLFDVALDGSIYAQPIVFPGGLLIATENNHVYVLDPVTGAPIADRVLDPPWLAADIGCGDLVPNVGITGTPVIDPSTNTAYLTTKTYASGTSGPAAHFLHALALPSLAEQPGFPVSIQGAADNQTDVTFDPTHQLQRTGLLLSGGSVYAGFGSHCGIPPYKGWVFGFSPAGQIEARWSAEDRFNDGAGVWQAGGAPLGDGPGTFIVSTGNGESAPVPAPGNTPPNVLGESWVRLTVQGNRTLLATDFFTPADAAYLNSIDADFGSGGPVGLPDSMGTPSVPRLGVAAGKSGYVYLLDRGDLGGFAQGPGGLDKVVQRLGPIGGVWSRSAVWPGEGGWTYLPTASPGNSPDGTTGHLNVFRAGTDATGLPTLALAGQADGDFGFGSSPPVVTSNGTSPGTGLVWIIYSPDGTGVGGELRAYDTRPVGGTLPLRVQLPIGRASKFNPPGVGDGRIYVGNRDGHVLGFGNTAPVTLTGSPVDLGVVGVGGVAVAPFQLLASQTVTVSALASSSSEFTPSTVTPPLPITLGAGAILSGIVAFQPASAGLRTGALVATTDSGTFALGVSGTGLVAGPSLQASAQALAFDPTLVGQQTILAITFTNLGDTPLPVSSVSVAGPPFSLTGAPAGGFVMGPGQSVTITVTFAPSAGGTFQDNLTLASSAGPVVIPLSGSAVEPARLDVDPAAVDFGTVQIGQSKAQSFTVSNGGGQRLTITRSKPPSTGVGFTGSALPEGTSLGPGESRAVTVTFAPTSNGPLTDQWVLNADGTQGTLTVVFTGTGAGATDPGTDGGTAGTGGGISGASHGCTAAAGSALWPLLLLVGLLLRPRLSAR